LYVGHSSTSASPYYSILISIFPFSVGVFTQADGTVEKIMEQWQGKRVIYLTEDYFQNFYIRSVILFLLLAALVAIYFARHIMGRLSF
jgi:hypothetical protein